jgi:hypothetical protein
MEFSVTNLTDHQKGHLEFIMNSPSYADIFKPYLLERRDILLKMLLHPAETRKDALPDDYLRGAIHTIDNLLSFFDKLIAETQIARMGKSIKDLPSDAQYAALAAKGAVGPHGRPVRDYDPSTEF